MSEARVLVNWLCEEARLETDRGAFIAAFAERLRSVGVPVDRLTTGIPILHPQIDTTSILWQVGKGAIERAWLMQPENYQMRANSPLHSAYFEGKGTRCRITSTPEPGEFGIIPDLREEGFTDYLVLPVPFADGSNKALTFGTKGPEGFGEDHVELLRALVPTLGVILELQTARRTAETLLTTYLGAQAGKRVLDGQIKRGDADAIHAVIWFSDLRGSTPLADSMAPEAFMALLNDYLECMATAVLEHGGEVLRFIGDAALGIFPISAELPVQAACQEAVAAARDAIARMEAINASRREREERAVEFGVGLHLGDVLYGNIGARARLEFTVTGAAANEAARIEGLCKKLGQHLLLSEPVAHHLADETIDLGTHLLRGVGSEVRIFTVA